MARKRLPIWVLMTRNLIDGSRDLTMKEQYELVKVHVNRTGVAYEVPKILEAATSIMMHYVKKGERLYCDKTWTNTRCQEKDYDEWGENLSYVGGFSSVGLCINSDYSSHNNAYGIGVVRKF